jgi:hypothetical protein
MLALIAEVRRQRERDTERRTRPTTAFCPYCASQLRPVPDGDWIDRADAERRALGWPAIQRMEPKTP